MITMILKKAIYIIFRILYKTINLLGKRITNTILRLIVKAFENSDDFLYLYIKPKDTNIVPKIIGLNSCNKFAIILQGPICTNNNITINTIMYYKKMYVGCDVIVSTWDDEPDKLIDEIKNAGAIIVINHKPDTSGILNVNYQLTNTLSAIKKVKELGYKYVAKTRTDQRICNPYFFDTVMTTLKCFPTEDPEVQEERIALLSSDYGNMFTPYFMSDFLYFGRVDDMIKLFSAPIDKRVYFEMEKTATRRENSKLSYAPEIYILKHYLQDHLNYKCNDTVESYWNAIKKYFICFSIKDADILWRKYDYMCELNRLYGEYFSNCDSEDIMATMSFDFMNWLNLYYGVTNYKKEYEKYADAPMKLIYKSNFKEK